MIPPLDDRGLLPPGVHEASGWDEVKTRFANNARRIQLLNNLMQFTADHLIGAAEGLDLYLSGSFLSDKLYPGDIDCAVTVRQDKAGQRPELLALGALGNKGPFFETLEVEFYLTLQSDEFPVYDLVAFFQYVGEKTAVAKGLDARAPRGIVKVMSWNQL